MFSSQIPYKPPGSFTPSEEEPEPLHLVGYQARAHAMLHDYLRWTDRQWAKAVSRIELDKLRR